MSTAHSSMSLPPPITFGPLALHLEIVVGVNLKCRHCFAGSCPPGRSSTLDTRSPLRGSGRIGTFLGSPSVEALAAPRPVSRSSTSRLAHGLCPCLTTNLNRSSPMSRPRVREGGSPANVQLDGAYRRLRLGAWSRDLRTSSWSVLTILGTSHPLVTLASPSCAAQRGGDPGVAELAPECGAHTAVLRPLYPVVTACREHGLMPTFAEYQERCMKLAGAGVTAGCDLRASNTSFRNAPRDAVCGARNYGS